LHQDAKLFIIEFHFSKDMVIVRRDGSATPSDAFIQAEMEQLPVDPEERREALRTLALDRVDDFVATHDLQIRLPKELLALAEYVPKSLIEVPAQITVPLSSGPVTQGRFYSILSSDSNSPSAKTYKTTPNTICLRSGLFSFRSGFIIRVGF
jgi:hypothetical protein